MEINQKDSEEFYNKGVELGDLGKNEEAVVCYDKVLEINSNDFYALYNKGYRWKRN